MKKKLISFIIIVIVAFAILGLNKVYAGSVSTGDGEHKETSVAPTGTLDLSNIRDTNQPVIVILTTNIEIVTPDGWTKLGTLKYSKIYYQNANESIKLVDIKDPSNVSIITISIKNIDTIPPKVRSIEYSETEMTNQDVVVTVKFDENEDEYMDFQAPWIALDPYGMVQQRTFERNVDYIETFRDLAGNETTAHIKIDNIDKDPPELEIVKTPTNPTMGNVTVTINSNEIMQNVDGWKMASNKMSMTKTYTENTSETIAVKDVLGNTVNPLIEITNIDRIAPVCTVEYSTTELTNKDIIATITADEYIVAAAGWELQTDGKTLTKTFKESSTENVKITDLAGNSSMCLVSVTNVDQKPIETDVTYSNKLVTNQEVTAQITTNKPVKITNNSFNWNISADRKVLTKKYNENSLETLKLEDDYGNKTDVKVELNNFDYTGPTIVVSRSQNINNKVYLTLSAMDVDTVMTSGVDTSTMMYSLQSSSKEPTEYTDKFTNGQVITKVIRGIETYFLWVRCADKLGNVSSQRFEVQQDNLFSYNTRVNYSTTEITKEDVTVTISANAELRELNGWKLSDNNKYSMTKVYSENTNETFAITDVNGLERYVTVNIANINKSGNPIVTPTGDLNKNGKIDVGDILKMQRHIATQSSKATLKKHPDWVLSDELIQLGDVNRNGKIDVGDILKLQRYLAACADRNVAKKHPEWLEL